MQPTDSDPRLATAPAAARAVPRHPRAAASYAEDLVTAAAGTWLILALFSDGWAHLNVPELESFFTPWHGALYSGFAAAAVWVGVLGGRRGVTVADAVRGPLSAIRRLPSGYPAAAVGVLVFGVGGVLDLLWHSLFGVEEGLDALLSPSHLVLFAGGVLLLSAPVRGAWAGPVDAAGNRSGGSLRARFPEVLSLTLTTGLVAFFLLYVSAFVRPAVQEPFQRIPEGAPGHAAAELPAVAGLAGYLVTTALLVVPLLLLAQRGRPPRGAVTLLISGVAWLSVALTDFRHPEVAVAATLAGGLADLLLTGPRLPWRLAAVGAVVPALVWPAQIAAVALVEGIGYPVALWSGIAVLAVLAGAALGLLAEGARPHVRQ